MRTVLTLPDEDVERLDRLARREGVSRAELIRRAVRALLQREGVRDRRDALGIWADRGDDGLRYQRRLRREWRR